MVRRLRMAFTLGIVLILAACEDDATTAAPDAKADAASDAVDASTADLPGVPSDTVQSPDTKRYTGSCAGGPAVCDDSNPCTIDDCDNVLGCIATVKDCADADPCTVDACDVATGNCKHTAGACDDGNACTVDTCKPEEGCLSDPLDCSDGNFCTADGCDPGVGCVLSPVNCDDGQTCTSDSCDPQKGCVHDKPEGAQCCETPLDCEDGSPCTLHACSGGLCINTPVLGCCGKAADCDDGSPCTEDACNSTTGLCGYKQVDGAGCCATDADCNDNLATTLDKCVGNACSHEATACTGASACAGVPLCADATCTTAGCALLPTGKAGCCQPSVASTGFEDGDSWSHSVVPGVWGQWQVGTPGKTGAKALRYVPEANPIPGAPGTALARLQELELPAGVESTLQFSTQVKLQGGETLRLRALTSAGQWVLWQGYSASGWVTTKLKLTGLAARAATRKVKLQFEITSQKNPLTSVFVDDVTVSSTCAALPACKSNGECNDGLAATSEECASGVCVYEPNAEYCESSATCDDGNACTIDSCGGNQCQHIKKSNCCLQTSDCDDKNVCTTDVCPAPGATCQWTKKPGSECCNKVTDCNDGNLCTQDLCPTVGLACEHTQTDANCCLTVKDCDDGDACTIDTCQGNQCGHKQQCCTTAADCDDGDPVCTDDQCVGGFCQWKSTGKCCEPVMFSSDFEGGLPTWLKLTGGQQQPKWQWITGKQAHGGKGALWFGNPATGNFEVAPGAPSAAGGVELPVSLPNGETLEFAFWVWADTESGNSYDKLRVDVVDGFKVTEIWNKASLPMTTWTGIKLSLGAWGGKTVTLRIYFDSVDSAINDGEGVYVDDLQLVRACGPATCKSAADCNDKLPQTVDQCASGFCSWAAP